MYETITSSPYDTIIQQQIDIVAKCQKDYLEGKDNSLQLIEAVNLLVTIKGCTPLQPPILGAVGVAKAFGHGSRLGSFSGNMTTTEAKARLGDDYATDIA